MPTPIITIEGSRATEGQYITFTVRLSEPALDAVSVNFQAYSGSAERNVDFDGYSNAVTSGVLTFGIGQTVQTFTIRATYDYLDEFDESFFVELTDARGATFGPGNASAIATGWVLDDDGIGLDRAIAISAPVVTEGAGNQAVFTLSLSEAFGTDRTFTFSTFDGSARAGSDYVARTGTVTFLAGQTEATVAVNLINDNLTEATESFGLSIRSAHDVVGTVGMATILDTDAAQPVISIEGSRATEGQYITFTVRLSEPALDAVSVNFQAYSGSAERNVDFDGYSTAVTSGVLTFGIGQTVQTFTIRATYDYLDEFDESFFVELTDARGATFGPGNASAIATGWVLDDDGIGLDRAIAISAPVVTEGAGNQAVFTLSLSEAFGTDRTFTFSTFDGSARAGSDYVARTGTVTFLAGQTEATVAVNLINDNLTEATESFGLSIRSAHDVVGTVGMATILDTDAAQPVISIEGSRATEGQYITFTVRLSEPALDAVSVNFRAYSGSAESNVDFDGYSTAVTSGVLTFGIGQTVQTFTIRATYDYLDEIDESFFVQLSNPTGATFGPGNNTLSATGWVLDDDGVGVNRSVSVSSTELREGPGGRMAVFVVELSQPSGSAVTLNYQTVAGTAQAGTDFTARSGQITFVPGQTRVEISVPVAYDLTLEGTEQFYLRVAPPFPGEVSSRTGIITGTATILDGTIRGTEADNILNGTIAADRIEGFGGNDQLNGGGGNDILVGGLGNDTLNGGAGADRMLGGIGNDTYYVDAAGDVVVENAGAGIDTVIASVSYALAANVENLVLAGTGAINGTGNALANTLTGNAGANILSGGAGNDTYIVGAGDRVVEGVGGGIDTVRSSVSFTLGANVENLVLTGTAAINGTGNALANTLTGNAGANILSGGMGNDTYVIGAGDRVVEAAGAGIDTVRTAMSYTLVANVENLVLLGVGNFNGTGNLLNNLLQGNTGNNNLNGGAGSDRIFGGLGNDTLLGGLGFDTLSGDAGNDYLSGGAGNDSLLGGLGNDTLNGDAGTDFLTGGGGTDIMRGGTERDVFVFNGVADSRAGAARDRILDFVSGLDDIDLRLLDANSSLAGDQAFAFRGTVAAANSVWYVQQGANALVRADVNGDGLADFELLLNGVSRLTAADFML